MPFAVESKSNKTFEKANYLKMTPGTHMVRFLQTGDQAKVIWSHFILGKYSVLCLDDECPICANNKHIMLENPDDYRDVKGYYGKSKHFVLNVLDRTPVKVCPQCQAEVTRGDGAFPPACPECQTMIVDVKAGPSNKVKLLTLGVTLATQLNSIEKSVTNDEGEPLGLTTFDIALAVEGTGRMKTTTPIANPQRNDIVQVPEEAYQDPDQAVIKLSATEIIDLLRGVAFKDIMAARRGGKDAQPVKSTETSETIKNKVSKLFSE